MAKFNFFSSSLVCMCMMFLYSMLDDVYAVPVEILFPYPINKTQRIQICPPNYYLHSCGGVVIGTNWFSQSGRIRNNSSLYPLVKSGVNSQNGEYEKCTAYKDNYLIEWFGDSGEYTNQEEKVNALKILFKSAFNQRIRDTFDKINSAYTNVNSAGDGGVTKYKDAYLKALAQVNSTVFGFSGLMYESVITGNVQNPEGLAHISTYCPNEAKICFSFPLVGSMPISARNRYDSRQYITLYYTPSEFGELNTNNLGFTPTENHIKMINQDKQTNYEEEKQLPFAEQILESLCTQDYICNPCPNNGLVPESTVLAYNIYGRFPQVLRASSGNVPIPFTWDIHTIADCNLGSFTDSLGTYVYLDNNGKEMSCGIDYSSPQVNIKGSFLRNSSSSSPYGGSDRQYCGTQHQWNHETSNW